VLYNAGKDPQGLSWQQVFLHLTGVQSARAISFLFLAAFPAGALWLTRRIEDLATYTLLTLLLFIVCSKVVLSHYLIWAMPLLVLAVYSNRTGYCRNSTVLLVVFTVIGMQMNPYYHPFGQYPELAAYLLATATVIYLAVTVRANTKGSGVGRLLNDVAGRIPAIRE
jgi:uncharacterized membrane protein